MYYNCTYRYIDPLSSFLHSHQCRLHFLGHISLQHSYDCNSYHTCHHKLPQCSSVYTYRYSFHKRLQNNEQNTMMYTCLPNNPVYSYYSVRYFDHRFVNDNLRGTMNHRSDPRILPYSLMYNVHLHYHRCCQSIQNYSLFRSSVPSIRCNIPWCNNHWYHKLFPYRNCCILNLNQGNVTVRF